MFRLNLFDHHLFWVMFILIISINTTLNLSTVNLAQNGNQYRVIINGECTVDLTSTAATLNVNTPVTITQQPSGIAGCAGSTVNFNVAANGTSISYQWQLSVNGGAFVNLVNNNQCIGGMQHCCYQQ